MQLARCPCDDGHRRLWTDAAYGHGHGTACRVTQEIGPVKDPCVYATLFEATCPHPLDAGDADGWYWRPRAISTLTSWRVRDVRRPWPQRERGGDGRQWRRA